ncbi:nucleoside phosphorylase [Haloferula luteola]|uniref:Nucleoside phosphorylase n=1 Tax=Haloferula luteola TaxID=595692 RepID=A0A840V7I1_9BACT|nr:hypothetical protein [Haloferula luteola]MBB5353673.1 nucleoside phosphorylase [Haloferula luteola]
MIIGIVEDNLEKAESLRKFLEEKCLSAEDSHVTWSCILDALAGLMTRSVDLLILDIVLPLRNGDNEPLQDGGSVLLTEIHSRESIKRPRFILGLTEYQAVAVKTSDVFNDFNWHLVEYSSANDRWKHRVSLAVEHLRARRDADKSREHLVDFAIITALSDPEFRQVMQVFPELDALATCRYSPTWHHGSVETNNGNRTIVAASAGSMGSASAAILTQRIISEYRPKVILLLGIAAGSRGEVIIGDVVFGNYVFTHDSGKRKLKGDEVVFEPSPHPLNVDLGTAARVAEPGQAAEIMCEAVHAWPAPVPDGRLKLRVGPVACGNQVIATADVMKELAARQDRKLLALDMESHGVILTCESESEPKPRGFVLKGICDYADESKADDFQPFAAFMSAMVARKLVERGLLEASG